MEPAERTGLLMFRHIRHELSPAEEAELSAWRSLSPENEAFFLETTDPENIRLQVRRMYETSGRVFKKLREQFPDRLSALDSLPEKPHSPVYRILRIVAIFVVVTGCYFFIREITGHSSGSIHAGEFRAALVSPDGVSTGLDDFHRGFLAGYAGIKIEKGDNGELLYIAPDNPRAAKHKYYRLYTPRGGEFILQLPGGMRVRLNAQSSIKYPANFFQDTTQIMFEGEAYFEIPADSGTLFSIMVNTMQVETHGASFNVTSYPGELAATVTLLKGTANIRLRPATDPSQISVLPGRQVQLDSGKLLVRSITDTNDIVAWKNGMISFHNADIQTIMRAVSRWYDVDIVYKGNIPDKKFNIHLPRNTGISELLSTLKQQGIHFLIAGKTITIIS